MAAIGEAHLRRHVETLAGAIGERNVFRPGALRDAAAYVEDEWRAQGYAPQREAFAAGGTTCANIHATLPGRGRAADEVLLVGAHYDTVRGSPEADDNASGVAGLLELSRALAAGPAPARTVRFVAFTNEEPPFFLTGRQGSAVHAAAARARGERIALMVSLEMLGFYDDRPGSQRYPPLFRRFYPDRGDFLGFVADFRSRRVMRRAAAAFRRSGCGLPLATCATFRWVPGWPGATTGRSGRRATWR